MYQQTLRACVAMLICAGLSTGLISCVDSDALDEPTIILSEGTPEIGLLMPPELLTARMVDLDQLRPIVTIEREGTSPRIVGMSRNADNTWSGAFTLSQPGEHTLIIQWVEIFEGVDLFLAETSVQINQDSTRQITLTEYNTEFDDDFDGVSNLQERNLGTSPFVVESDDGTIGGSDTLYAIGDTGPAGGIVFYVTDGGLHGQEAAPVDQSSNIPWGCNRIEIAGADGTDIGTGEQNTVDILAGCADRPIAASVADAYQLNGFSDWFLPSRDELNLMYDNLHLSGMGGFAIEVSNYWSSSLFDIGCCSVWNQRFETGLQFGTVRDGAFRTRAIRGF